MKILYIAPENTVGTLTLWRNEHMRRGNECRSITFFNSPKKFDEDICLNLPFNFTNPKMSKIRNLIYKRYRGPDGYHKEKIGYPPVWKPDGKLDSIFLKCKDFLWKPYIERAINEYQLYDFDIFHFESGVDFLKNESFVKGLKKRGKKIICHYHGEDLRARGVMPYMDTVSDLNLTNELDLLHKHPKISYLFLPFDTSKFQLKETLNDKITITHAPTNRFYKGSNIIIDICKNLESEGKIKFKLVENLPNNIALEKKMKSDICIDQIGNRGGWGYGMNSVESLSMGICTLTEMNDKYNNFLPGNPFVNVNKHTLDQTLRNLINNPGKILFYGKRGRKWVKKKHDIKKVGDVLYGYYEMLGLK